MGSVTVRLRSVLLAAVCAWFASCDDKTNEASIVQPSYAEPCAFVTCGGNGECHASESGTPTCMCNPGFQGPGCDQCEVGFHRDVNKRCVPDKSCAEQAANPCGAYGNCSDTSGVIECACDVGYEGPRCTLCAERYGRDERGRCLPQFLGGAQNDGGAAAATDAMLTCDKGYTGPFCALCAPGYHTFGRGCVIDETCEPQTCAQHGSCEVASGEAVCTCASGYTGAECGRCASGFHPDGNNCVADQFCQPASCGANAICSVNAGQTVCTCAPGYTGTNCNQCSGGYHRVGGNCVQDQVCEGANCPARSRCEITGGEIACVCNDGYVGAGTCTACAAGWHSTGNGVCVKDETCVTNSCSAHASCSVVGGLIRCDCHSGYLGVGCEFCALGYHKVTDGSCVPDETCSDTSCPEHAYCVVAGGQVQCPCRTDWAGPMCSRCTNLAGHTTDFDTLPGWPAVANTCTTLTELKVPPLTLRSLGGAGSVYTCAPSSFNGLTTPHIELELATGGAASLEFAKPVVSLAFDYGARLQSLEFEVMADGVRVAMVNLPRKSKGSVSLQLTPSARTITLRSMSIYAQSIGIDNIVYQDEQCQR